MLPLKARLQLLSRKQEKHRTLRGPRVQLSFVQEPSLRDCPLCRLRLRCVAGVSWSQACFSLLPHPAPSLPTLSIPAQSCPGHAHPSPAFLHQPPKWFPAAPTPHTARCPPSCQDGLGKLLGHDAPLCSSLHVSPNKTESKILATDQTGTHYPSHSDLSLPLEHARNQGSAAWLVLQGHFPPRYGCFHRLPSHCSNAVSSVCLLTTARSCPCARRLCSFFPFWEVHCSSSYMHICLLLAWECPGARRSSFTEGPHQPPQPSITPC